MSYPTTDPPSTCLLIIQTTLSPITLSKTLTPKTPEHTSWHTTLRTLLNHSGVYELHYAERRSAPPKASSSPSIFSNLSASSPPPPNLDILLSIRTPADHTSFRHDPTIADTLSALAPAIAITSQLYIPRTPDLNLRGLQGDTVEAHFFSFRSAMPDDDGADEVKRRLFEQRVNTYVSLMMDRRRSDAGYGAHLLGPTGKLGLLLMGGVRKSRGVAESRLLGWTGGWVECSSDDNIEQMEDEEDEDGRGMGRGLAEGFVLILGWQGAAEAKASMSFLDKLPAKGVRKRRAGVEDAKKRWGVELGMGEEDWMGGGEERTHEVFWPLCTRMVEGKAEVAEREKNRGVNGVRSETYVGYNRIFAVK